MERGASKAPAGDGAGASRCRPGSELPDQLDGEGVLQSHLRGRDRKRTPKAGGMEQHRNHEDKIESATTEAVGEPPRLCKVAVLSEMF